MLVPGALLYAAAMLAEAGGGAEAMRAPLTPRERSLLETVRQLIATTADVDILLKQLPPAGFKHLLHQQACQPSCRHSRAHQIWSWCAATNTQHDTLDPTWSACRGLYHGRKHAAWQARGTAAGSTGGAHI